MIFAIPRGRVTYIGTTDTDYKEDKESVRTSLADVKYLVSAVNETFPSSHLTVADVESTWAGLRPLIHEEGKSASELSRKDEIFESDSGLISIAGGKRTGSRTMAERVVDRIIETKFSSKELTPCMTENLGLAGMAFHSPAEVTAYTKTVADRTERLGLKGGAGAYLVHLYGKQADEILQLAEKGNREPPEARLTLAELEFALTRECCLRLDDFLIRRTGMLYFDIHRLQRVRATVVEYLVAKFDWDAGRITDENRRMDELIKYANEFPET
jgi:glycerol-3-phosphate dehydrogenase